MLLSTLAYCVSAICDKNKLRVATRSRRTEDEANPNPSCSPMQDPLIPDELSRIPANPPIWLQEKSMSVVVSGWGFTVLCYTSLFWLIWVPINQKYCIMGDNAAAELGSEVGTSEFEFWLCYLWALEPWGAWANYSVSVSFPVKGGW